MDITCIKLVLFIFFTTKNLTKCIVKSFTYPLILPFPSWFTCSVDAVDKTELSVCVYPGLILHRLMSKRLVLASVNKEHLPFHLSVLEFSSTENLTRGKNKLVMLCKNYSFR